MLGVCSEFERVAKVVLDKAEKESSSRRKRKSHDHPDPKTKVQPHTPRQNNAATPPMNFSPSVANQMRPQSTYSPRGSISGPINGLHAAPSPFMDLNADTSEYATPNGNTNGGMTPFADVQGFTNGNQVNSPLNPNSFQQPFVPQDLWQMPMTLEWDWADMTGGAYPSFENGIVGDPNLFQSQNSMQHLQSMQ